MYQIITLFFLFTVIPTLQAQKSTITETINGKTYYSHFVENGQTTYSISKLYGVDISELIQCNPFLKEGLKANQTILVPMSERSLIEVDLYHSSSLKKPTEFIYHEVKKQETLYSISIEYGVKIEEVEYYNPYLKKGLKEGQVLKIPQISNTQRSNDLENNFFDSIAFYPPVDSLVADTENTAKQARHKGVYNIVFLLPFHVSDINRSPTDSSKITLSPTSKYALMLYYGLLSSLDSLKQMGFQCNIKVLDSSVDTSKFMTVLKGVDWAETDLCIGPFYRNKIDYAAKYVYTINKTMPMVCPVPNTNKILLSNPNVHKTIPSDASITEKMAEYIKNKHVLDRKIMLTNTKGKDEVLCDIFEASYARFIQEKSMVNTTEKNLVSYAISSRGFNALLDTLSVIKNNVLIIPSTDQVFVSDMLTKINHLHEDFAISLYGMGKWETFENLDVHYLQNLNVTLGSEHGLNKEMDDFEVKFYNKHSILPDRFAMYGYSTGLFYFSALLNQGTNMNEYIHELPTYQSYNQKFELQQTGKSNGFENKGYYLLNYKDFKIVEVN